jgi:hypothetical protein
MMQVRGLLCETLPGRLQVCKFLMQSLDFGDAHPQRRRSVSSEGPGLDGKPQVYCLSRLCLFPLCLSPLSNAKSGAQHNSLVDNQAIV